MERLREQLIAQRDRMTDQLEYMERAMMRSSLRDTAGDQSGYSTHLADAGTDHAEREKGAQLTAAELRLLESINDALERIEQGNYGLCQDCGSSISMGRLLAIPDATRCIDCQEAYDRSVQDGGA
jgi:RNA polymerase-binding protein DksA